MTTKAPRVARVLRECGWTKYRPPDHDEPAILGFVVSQDHPDTAGVRLWSTGLGHRRQAERLARMADTLRTQGYRTRIEQTPRGPIMWVKRVSV